MTELKPCPFCGGEAELVIDGTDDCPCIWVQCKNGCCSIRFCETEAEAIEAWNKRVPPTNKEIEEYIEKTHKENMEMIAKLKRKCEVEK